MAFSYVQSKSANNNSTSPSVTLTSGATAGNLLVAGVYSNSNPTVAPFITLSGWTALTQATSSGANRLIGLFWKIASGGETTITASTNTGSWNIAVVEYSPGGQTVAGPTLGSSAEGAAVHGSTTVPPTPNLSGFSGSGVSGLVVAFSGIAANDSVWSNWTIGNTTTGVNQREAQNRSGASSSLYDVMPSSLASTYNTNSATASPTAATTAGAIALFYLNTSVSITATTARASGRTTTDVTQAGPGVAAPSAPARVRAQGANISVSVPVTGVTATGVARSYTLNAAVGPYLKVSNAFARAATANPAWMISQASGSVSPIPTAATTVALTISPVLATNGLVGREAVWNGSAWVSSATKIWNGSAWVSVNAKIRDSSKWNT